MYQVAYICLCLFSVHLMVSAVPTDQEVNGLSEVLKRLEILEKEQRELIKENKQLKGLLNTLGENQLAVEKRTKRQAPTVQVPPKTNSSDCQGACCVRGPQGPAGRDGRDGIQGIQGPAGPRGAPGPSGTAITMEDLQKILSLLKGKQVNILQELTGTGEGGNNLGVGTGSGGSVYTRWGRSSCPYTASLVYEGVIGGSYYTHGGGSNYLCLPRDPSWLNYTDGFQSYGRMYGVEYEVNMMPNDFFSKQNIPPGIKSIHDQDAVCAVCHTPGRPTKLMIPAKTSCPGDWLMEYKGYLMAENYSHRRAQYICVDEMPEIDASGKGNQNGGLLYNVEAACGSLPCPNYVDGRELACVVCTM